MTSHTDYALRMLIYLAMHPDRACTVNDVAGAYGLSRNHLLKVARTLRKLGYIGTARGRVGGIRLAAPPERINIGALVRATEADFALVDCLRTRGGNCAIAPACMLKGVFSEALAAYLAVLDKCTLADVARNTGALRSLLGIGDHAA